MTFSLRPTTNLLDSLPKILSAAEGGEEFVEEMASGAAFRLERIVSTGQATPPGVWYDQDQAEWVVLLSGKARLRFEEEPQVRELCAGDAVSIPAHCRHRVEWTSPDEETVWIALHFVAD